MRFTIWAKALVFTLLIAAACVLAVAAIVVPYSRDMVYRMEERFALARLESVQRLVSTSLKELEAFRESALAAKKRELRNLTQVVGSYIELIHAQTASGAMSEAEAMSLAIERVRGLRYGHKDYFWISDFKSVLISHPDPKLHGVDYSDIRDVQGNLMVPAMVAVARDHYCGFTSYWWRRLKGGPPVEKLTYSQLFLPWEWVFSTGVYIDDIEEEAARRQEEIIRRLREMILETTFAKTGYMFMFHGSGKLIIHPNADLEGRYIQALPNSDKNGSLLALLKNAADRPDKPAAYVWDHPRDRGNDAYEKLAWVRRFDDRNWYLAASVYTDELHASSNAMTVRMVATAVAVFLLCSLVGALVLRRSLVPLQRLALAASKVGGGDLSVCSRVRGNDEIGMLGREFDSMVGALDEHVRDLDGKVREKTRELSDSVAQLKEANAQIMDSIDYARTIQLAILPRIDPPPPPCREFFAIWEPKDVIGGDFYWVDQRQGVTCVGVIDCTGHGVPGAIMTMTACMALRRAAGEVGVRDPALLLSLLNRYVRDALGQRDRASGEDDGMDIGLVAINPAKGNVTFAGAGIQIHGVDPDGVLETLRGEKMGIGYKSSDPDYTFTNHVFPLEPDTRLYMATDGLIHQCGGPRGFPFGRSRFLARVAESCRLPMGEQGENILQAFRTWQGDQEQRDDVTVVGFRL